MGRQSRNSKQRHLYGGLMMLGRVLPASTHTPQAPENQGQEYLTVSSPETVAVIAHMLRLYGPQFVAAIYGGLK